MPAAFAAPTSQRTNPWPRPSVEKQNEAAAKNIFNPFRLSSTPASGQQQAQASSASTAPTPAAPGPAGPFPGLPDAFESFGGGFPGGGMSGRSRSPFPPGGASDGVSSGGAHAAPPWPPSGGGEAASGSPPPWGRQPAPAGGVVQTNPFRGARERVGSGSCNPFLSSSDGGFDGAAATLVQVQAQAGGRLQQFVQSSQTKAQTFSQTAATSGAHAQAAVQSAVASAPRHGSSVAPGGGPSMEREANMLERAQTEAAKRVAQAAVQHATANPRAAAKLAQAAISSSLSSAARR